MKSFNGLSLALGIVGIVVSIIFAPLFGFIPALIGLALSVVGIILAINTKKATNNEQGTGGFVCGLIGAILGAIFFIGCLACGSCGGGYGAWGCVGGTCNAVDDAADELDDWSKELEKALKDLENLY